MPEYNLPIKQSQQWTMPVAKVPEPVAPVKLPLRGSSTAETFTAPTIRKYELNYDTNGDIYYGGRNIGNLLYTDLIDLGEEVWLENWAKQNKVDLTPSTAWINANQKQDYGMGQRPQQQIAPVDKVDPTEESLVKSMAITDQQRASDKPQENFLSGLANMNPLNTQVNLPGVNELGKWQDNPEGYGKGFEPGNINPFFTK